MEAPYVLMLCGMACFVGFGLYQKRLETARARAQEDRKKLLELLAPEPSERPSETSEGGKTSKPKRSKASTTVLYDGPEGSLPGEDAPAKGKGPSEDIDLEVDPDWSTAKDRVRARVDEEDLAEVDPGWMTNDRPSRS